LVSPSIIGKNVQVRAIDARPISPDEFAKQHPEAQHTITIEVTREQAHALSQFRERKGSFGIILHGNLAAEGGDEQR